MSMTVGAYLRGQKSVMSKVVVKQAAVTNRDSSNPFSRSSVANQGGIQTSSTLKQSVLGQYHIHHAKHSQGGSNLIKIVDEPTNQEDIDHSIDLSRISANEEIVSRGSNRGSKHQKLSSGFTADISNGTRASLEAKKNISIEPKLMNKQDNKGMKSCTNIFQVEEDYGIDIAPFNHRGRLAVASFHDYNNPCTNEKIEHHRQISHASSQTRQSPFVCLKAPINHRQDSSSTISIKTLEEDNSSFPGRYRSKTVGLLQPVIRVTEPQIFLQTNALQKALFVTAQLERSLSKEPLKVPTHSPRQTSQNTTMHSEAMDECLNQDSQQPFFEKASPRDIKFYHRAAAPTFSFNKIAIQKQEEKQREPSKTQYKKQNVPLSIVHSYQLSSPQMNIMKSTIEKQGSNHQPISKRLFQDDSSSITQFSCTKVSPILLYSEIKQEYHPSFIIKTFSVDYKCTHEQMIPVLFGSVRFFNIDMLIALASTSKKFQKRKDVKYVINSQLRFLVINGLSTIDRLKFWNHRTRFAFYRRKYQGLYFNILDTHRRKIELEQYNSDTRETQTSTGISQAILEIQKDVDRTLPSLKYFKEKNSPGQQQLERMLTGVALYYKKLGYVQGMNFLAATLILSFSGCSRSESENEQREEEAFWMMISIMVNFKYDKLLTFENCKFKVLCFQIDMFVKAYLPDVYQIFKDKCGDLSSEYYASPWILTFFAVLQPQQNKSSSMKSDQSSFDLNFVLCVIDLFLLEGVISLIRICLAILASIKEDLFDLQYEEILVYLKTFSLPQKSQSTLWSVITDIEAFYSKALKYTVTRGMLEQLEGFYEDGTTDKSQLELNLEKKRWEIVHKQEIIIKQQEQTIGEKVKGLFNWFGNSPSNKAAVGSNKSEIVIGMPRQRNNTFHQTPKTLVHMPLKELSQNDPNHKKQGDHFKKVPSKNNPHLSIMDTAAGSFCKSPKVTSLQFGGGGRGDLPATVRNNHHQNMGSGLLKPK